MFSFLFTAMISARTSAFYPPTTVMYLDADGPAGVDFENLVETLSYVKANGGKLPDTFKSWQSDVFPGQEASALRMVPEETLKQLSDKVSAQLEDAKYSIVITEGFLLYHMPDIRTKLDGKLFMRLNHQKARRRRLTRPSYGAEAKEGEFWKTEDYFEKMVWRNYVEQHADLFEDGNVEGGIDSKVCSERGIAVQEGMNMEMAHTLTWAMDTILSLLKKRTTRPQIEVPLKHLGHSSIHPFYSYSYS
jgi:nicotinamide/nicotinate riboside kinase